MEKRYKYLFYINKTSGNVKEKRWNNLLDNINNVFKNSDHHYCFYTSDRTKFNPVHLKEYITENEIDIIVIIGGDGTINTIISTLIDIDIIFSVIPAGSGNGFARGLNIDSSIVSIKKLLNPIVKTIDVGKINSNYFINVCGTGIDSLIAYEYNKYFSRMRGFIPYLLLTIKNLFFSKINQLTISNIDGNSTDMTLNNISFISIFNGNQWGYNAIINPNTYVNDNKMECVIIEHSKNIIKLFLYAINMFAGKIDRYSKYKRFKIENNITIELDKEFPIQVDGEYINKTDTINVEILKSRIKFVC